MPICINAPDRIGMRERCEDRRNKQNDDCDNHTKSGKPADMYESFFQLSNRPFPSAPCAELYFPAASTENTLQTLVRCIERAEGPGLLIGGAGTGKSLLCHLLADRFRDTFHVVTLSNARLCTRRALLQNILFELDLPYRGLEEGELRLSLIDFLDPGKSDREGMLLLVDEAHTLPLRLVEEIRLITNLVRDGQPRVRLVLVGGQTLEERLASPKLESLNQRVAARCYLQSLSYDETLQYVRAQTAAVEGNPNQIFAESALNAIHQASDGIPRLINQVCDHALMLAAVAEREHVDAGLIEEAWADLQQLPAPWQGSATEASSEESVVEFGALEEPAFEEEFKEEPAVAAPTDEFMAGVPSPCCQDTFELGPPPDHVCCGRHKHSGPEAETINLTEQIDEIELHVAEVEADDATGLDMGQAEEPMQEAQRECESSPDSARAQNANPFDESFEQEEIVVDPYARLRGVSGTSGMTVSTQQEQELAMAAETIFQGSNVAMAPEDAQIAETGWVDTGQDADAAMCDHVVTNETAADADCGADSQVCVVDDMGDEVDNVGDPAIVEAHVIRSLPPDDNDLIVVVDDQRHGKPLNSSVGKAHRQDYSQLFSKLRQG